MQLENQLYQLLYSHNCVILPGFGGFIGHHKSAEILPTQGFIRQPHKSISFNKNLVTNDGVVYNFIAHKLDITYNKAEDICREFTSILITKLQNGESIVFHNIGKLFLDFEKNIQFFPNHDENFERDSFGLKKISIQPIAYKQTAEEKTIVAPVKSIVETAAKKETVVTFENKEKLFPKEQVEDSTTTLPLVKIAAALVLAVCITASFLMMVNHQTGNSIGQQAGIFDTIVNVVFHKTPQPSTAENPPLVNAENVDAVQVSATPKETPIKSTTTANEDNTIIKTKIAVTTESKPISTNQTIINQPIKEEKAVAPKKQVEATAPIHKKEPSATAQKTKPEEKIKAESNASKTTDIKPEEAAAVAHVVFGSFKSEQNAKALLNKLSKEGIKASVVEGENGFKRVICKTNVQKADKLRSSHPGSWTLEQIGK